MEAIDLAFQRAEIVLLTGGLGPTKDDITKQTLCKYFNTKLIFNQGVIDNIQEMYVNRPNVLNTLTFSQAYVPETATIIQNKRGTAPVTWFDKASSIGFLARSPFRNGMGNEQRGFTPHQKKVQYPLFAS